MNNFASNYIKYGPSLFDGNNGGAKEKSHFRF